MNGQARYISQHDINQLIEDRHRHFVEDREERSAEDFNSDVMGFRKCLTRVVPQAGEIVNSTSQP